MFYSVDMNTLISMMLETQPDNRPTVQQILETEIVQRHIGESLLVRFPKNEELREIYEKYQQDVANRKLAQPLKFDPITKKMVSTFEKVSENDELIQLKDVEDFAEEEFGDEGVKVGKKKPSFLDEQRKAFHKKFNKKGGFRVKDDHSQKLFREVKEASVEKRERRKYLREKEKKVEKKPQKSAYSKMFMKKKVQIEDEERKIEPGLFYDKEELKKHNKEQIRRRKKARERKFKKPAKPWVGVMEEEDEVVQREKEAEEELKRQKELEDIKAQEAKKKKVVIRKKKAVKKPKKENGVNKEKSQDPPKKAKKQRVPVTTNRIRRTNNRRKKKEVPLNKASMHPRAYSMASDFSVESINKNYSEGVLNKLWGRSPYIRSVSARGFNEIFKATPNKRRASVTHKVKRGNMFRGIILIEIEKVYPKIKDAQQNENLKNLHSKIQMVEYLHTRKLCGRLAMRRNHKGEAPGNPEVSENFQRKLFDATKEMLNEEWAYEVEKIEIENEYFVKQQEQRRLRVIANQKREEELKAKEAELLEKRKEWYRQFNEAQEIKRKEEEEKQREYEAQFESLREMEFIDETKKEEEKEYEAQQEDMDNEFKGEDIDLSIPNEVGRNEEEQEEEVMVEIIGGKESGDELNVEEVEEVEQVEGRQDSDVEDDREEKGGNNVMELAEVEDEAPEETEDKKEEIKEKEEKEKMEEKEEKEEDKIDIQEDNKIDQDLDKKEEKTEDDDTTPKSEETKKNEDKPKDKTEEKVENTEDKKDSEKKETVKTQESEIDVEIPDKYEETNTEEESVQKEDSAKEDSIKEDSVKEESAKEEKEEDPQTKTDDFKKKDAQQNEEIKDETKNETINIFKETLETSGNDTLNNTLETPETLKDYDTGKFPNDAANQEPPKIKKLVPLERPAASDNQVRRNQFRQNYEDIIDYSHETFEQVDKEERINRLRQTRERIKEGVGIQKKKTNRDRLHDRDRSHSAEFAQDSEISEIYRNIKSLSRQKQMQLGGMLQGGEPAPGGYSTHRMPEAYDRNYYQEHPQNLQNFHSWGHEEFQNTASARDTLSKRQEVLNRTSYDEKINFKRKLSPNRNRKQLLRKKSSREEFGGRVKQQREILRLQYQKNAIIDNVRRSIPNNIIDDLMDEISKSFRNKGSFTLSDSKMVQRKLFGDFDYYQRKELPSLYKLIDLEVELMAKSGY